MLRTGKTRLKDFIVVLVATLLLMAVSWLGYFKLGWFH